MASTRIVTDGGVLIVKTESGTEAEIRAAIAQGDALTVETDSGTEEEARAVIDEVRAILNPPTASCGSVHPQMDMMCAHPHTVGGGDYRLEPVRAAR